MGLDIISLYNKYLSEVTVDKNHRYSSFDFCYSYFKHNRSSVASKELMETSCLHLGFYLASWGMLRGSSFLLQKNLKFYEQIVEIIASQKLTVWDIDVDNYSDNSIATLIDIYKEIAGCYHNHSHLTLTTKIMLGVFGNVPAFDQYFCFAFKNIYPNQGFTSFSFANLQRLREFYECYNIQIKELQEKTYCKNWNNETINTTLYTKAKIIDMIGFEHGKDLSNKPNKD